jgi:hypothetical protein
VIDSASGVGVKARVSRRGRGEEDSECVTDGCFHVIGSSENEESFDTGRGGVRPKEQV